MVAEASIQFGKEMGGNATFLGPESSLEAMFKLDDRFFALRFLMF